MNAKTPNELKENTKLACEATMLSGDSPMEKIKQIYLAVGYHAGYCQAMNWGRDFIFECEMLDLVKKMKYDRKSF